MRIYLKKRNTRRISADKIKADSLVELITRKRRIPLIICVGEKKNLNMLALGIAQQIQEAVSRYAH